jgi:hypothetical protein
MPGLNGSQGPGLYRVRIKDGHSASGLLVSATGKRYIPLTQYWLTMDACTAYRFPVVPHYTSRDGWERWDS